MSSVDNERSPFPDVLPIELLQSIFSSFTALDLLRCALVCKSLVGLSQTALFRRICLCDTGQTVGLVDALISNPALAVYIRELCVFSGPCQHGRRGRPAAVDSDLSKLVQINALEDLAVRIPTLSLLTLGTKGFERYESQALLAVQPLLKSVARLKLNDCTFRDNDSFPHFVSACHRLQSLTLFHITAPLWSVPDMQAQIRVNDLTVENTSVELVEPILSLLSPGALRSLRLKRMSREGDGRPDIVKRLVLHALSAQGSALHILDFAFQGDLYELAEKLTLEVPCLRQLHLESSDMPHFPLQDVEQLMDFLSAGTLSLPHLEHLSVLVGTSGAGIRELLRRALSTCVALRSADRPFPPLMTLFWDSVRGDTFPLDGYQELPPNALHKRQRRHPDLISLANAVPGSSVRLLESAYAPSTVNSSHRHHIQLVRRSSPFWGSLEAWAITLLL